MSYDIDNKQHRTGKTRRFDLNSPIDGRTDMFSIRLRRSVFFDEINVDWSGGGEGSETHGKGECENE